MYKSIDQIYPASHAFTQFINKYDKLGPSVKLAIERFDDFYQRYEYNPNNLIRFQEFCRKHILLSTGQFAGTPLELFDWTAFCFAHMLGFVDDEGFRITRRYYWEMPKGSGKSPGMAAFAIYMTFFDAHKSRPCEINGKRRYLPEPDAETYIIATTFDQSEILFSTIENTILGNDILENGLEVKGGTKPNLVYDRATGRSTIRRVAGGSTHSNKGKSGYIPHLVVYDEYHEAVSSEVYEKFALGVKARKQPMVGIITNSGDNVNTPCGQEHLTAKKVLRKEATDDGKFIFIADCDDGHWDNPTLWKQANLSLPVTPTWQFIEDRAREARLSPAKVTNFERLILNRWNRGVKTFIDYNTWINAEIDKLPSDLEVKAISIGTDLSSKKDLTAAVIAYETVEGDIYCESHAWMCANRVDELMEMDDIPYQTWIDEGFISTTLGEVIDISHLVQWIKDRLPESIELNGVATDSYRIDKLQELFETAGYSVNRATKENGHADGRLNLYPHPQGPTTGIRNVTEGKGLAMSRSMQETEEGLIALKIKVVKSPVMRQAIMGLKVYADNKGNRSYDRANSTGKVDPAVALIQAVGLSVLRRVGSAKINKARAFLKRQRHSQSVTAESANDAKNPKTRASLWVTGG